MASLGMANMMEGSIISIMSWSMYSFLRALYKVMNNTHVNSVKTSFYIIALRYIAGQSQVHCV